MTRSWSRRALMGPADVVAPSLLGSRLVSVVDGHRVVVRITEVEAYGGVGEDAASHAHRGPTPRNAAMFGPPGHAYVYLSYGMHWCMNVVTGPPGVGSAVLLRAGEVVDGLDTARARRATARADRDLARGPARLTAALGVDGRFDGVDLLRDGDIRLQRAGSGNDVGVPCRGPRIGIRREVDRPWRWWVAGNPTVSGTVRREG